MPKCVLFFSVTNATTTYPAPISTIFEIKDVNRFRRAYTVEKFPNFCTGCFPRPKTAEMDTVEGGVVVRELQLERHNFR